MLFLSRNRHRWFYRRAACFPTRVKSGACGRFFGCHGRRGRRGPSRECLSRSRQGRTMALSMLLLILWGVFVASAGAAAPAVMLAEVYDGSEELAIHDYWVSEKLDGVRGRWDGGRLYTRGGHVIAVPEWFTAGWPDLVMDGELWIARGRFAEVSGIVRSAAAG